MKSNTARIFGIASLLLSVSVTASCARQGLPKPTVAATSTVELITTAGLPVPDIGEFSAPSPLVPETLGESTNAPTAAVSTAAVSSTHAASYTTRYTQEQREQFFENAVFVGDSRVEDFVFFNGFPSGNCYASSGINVETFYTKECIEIDGKKYSPFDALSRREKLGRVYIGFGLNEIDWQYQDVFIKEYEKVIASIRTVDPQAQIYVMSILPVTEKAQESGEQSNSMIAESNLRIRKMAQENSATYADVNSFVADKNGCLPAFAAADGVHMGKKLNVQWAEYLYSLG